MGQGFFHPKFFSQNFLPAKMPFTRQSALKLSFFPALKVVNWGEPA